MNTDDGSWENKWLREKNAQETSQINERTDGWEDSCVRGCMDGMMDTLTPCLHRTAHEAMSDKPGRSTHPQTADVF